MKRFFHRKIQKKADVALWAVLVAGLSRRVADSVPTGRRVGTSDARDVVLPGGWPRFGKESLHLQCPSPWPEAPFATAGVGRTYWKTSLTSATIGSSVTSVPILFGTRHITFGTGLESVGQYAFAYCTSLTSITGYATTPPVCGDNVFFQVDKKTCVLYVPEESVELYKAADQWMEFLSINGIHGQ